MHREGSCSKAAGVLSKVQMLNLVLGVRVFSLLPRFLNIAVASLTAPQRLGADIGGGKSDLSLSLSFEPGFGAHQGLAQKIKVPFSRISSSFCSSEGSRAISKPVPNPGTHQTPVETLSEKNTKWHQPAHDDMSQPRDAAR